MWLDRPDRVALRVSTTSNHDRLLIEGGQAGYAEPEFKRELPGATRQHVAAVSRCALRCVPGE